MEEKQMPKKPRKTNLTGNKETLLQEVKRLREENKKLSRQVKMLNGLLEKDAPAAAEAEASDTESKWETLLNSVHMLQRTYTDMLLEFCPNIIFLLDNKGKFVLCTKALLREIGAADFDYIQRRGYKEIFADIFDSGACAKLKMAIDKVIETKERAVLNEYVDFIDKGSPRYYTIELTAIGGTGGIAPGILAVFHDLTDFMVEKERAETASKAKSDFLATVSHEIRTPMNAIMGMTEILSRTSLNDTQKEYIKTIKKSSSSLMSIINDILDFSKIEAGEMDIINNFYNLKEMFESLYGMFSPLFKNKDLEFYYSVSKAMPDVVYGDDKRLKQILMNILSNGLKYTPEGHVEFYAWMAEDQTLHVGIHDTGIGIRPKDVKKLFLPFEQLDLRKKENIVGTGLGLAISHRLCEMMNGNLSVESTYGAGSTFSVDIPCNPGEGEDAGENEDGELTEFSARDAKVLVVDDIEINLSVAEAMLQIFDISPDLAFSGKEALEMAAKKQYDVVFMDHMMPEMDGVEAMHCIRMINPKYIDTPIVALTANVTNEAKNMFIENGFDGFLPKPIEIDALNLCLRKFIPRGMIMMRK